MTTENAIKIFGAGGLKVTRVVPEKHIINFFLALQVFVSLQRNGAVISCDYLYTGNHGNRLHNSNNYLYVVIFIFY